MTAFSVETRTRPVRNTRYLIAIAALLAIWYLLNLWPTWRELGFFTNDFEAVLRIVNVALLTGAVANGVYIMYDAPWFRAAWQAVVSLAGLACIWRVNTAFPFDFSEYSYDFTWLTKGALVIGGVLLATRAFLKLVGFLRAAAAASTARQDRRRRDAMAGSVVLVPTPSGAERRGSLRAETRAHSSRASARKSRMIAPVVPPPSQARPEAPAVPPVPLPPVPEPPAPVPTTRRALREAAQAQSSPGLRGTARMVFGARKPARDDGSRRRR